MQDISPLNAIAKPLPQKAKGLASDKVKHNAIIKRIAIHNLRNVKAESPFIHKHKANIQLKYWAKGEVSFFIYSRMHVLEPVSETYVFGCTNRLKQQSIKYSVMQKFVIACVAERHKGGKGSCTPLSHTPDNVCSCSSENCTVRIIFSGMLARVINIAFLFICMSTCC